MNAQIKLLSICSCAFILYFSHSVNASGNECQYVKDKIKSLTENATALTDSIERQTSLNLLHQTLLSDIDTLEEPLKSEVCANAKLQIDTLTAGIQALESEAKR